jgi:DNA polymerase elongation subunit (family B)
LFKKYVPGERESYKLDDIAFEVLGANKLDHSEFESFQAFQDRDWKKFVEYNCIDVQLIVDIENKKKLLSQHISVAYMAGVNYEDVFSPVKTWDFFIQNELARENIFVDAVFTPPSDSSSIEGAYVKDPIVGRHEWVVSLDANSLYPSNIRSVNISSETIVEYDALPLELREFYLMHSVDALLKNVKKIEAVLKKYDLSFAPNGSFYRRKQSHIGKIVTRVYNGRADAKKLMIEKKKEKQKETDEKRKLELDLEISALDNKQNALKTLLNSFYGATANRFFRHFDNRCAEATTLTGQLLIRHVGNRVNEFLNQLLKTQDIDFVAYTDTDSVAGSSLIQLDNCQKTIEEIFNQTDAPEIKTSTGNIVKSKVGLNAAAVDSEGNQVYRPINYVMKHKVKKEMFKITVGKDSIICTSDHSLIVKRDEEIISIKPKDVLSSDKFIKLN